MPQSSRRAFREPASWPGPFRFLFEFSRLNTFHVGVQGLVQSAWEPVTPRGVAAFARASFGRLWLAQFIVASLVAMAVVWLLNDGFFPTVRAAIRKLPDAGDIRDAKLEWRGASPVLLAEGSFIAFSVDLDQSGGVRSPAHFQIEFGKDRLQIRSLLGYLDRRYPPGWLMAFNRPELEPKWGAWEMPLLGLAALAVIGWLFLVWSVLATVYALPVWLISFFANRDLNLAACWRLAGAALMPGAVIMALALVLYGWGAFDLLALGSVAIGHVVVGWIYLCLGPAFLPRAAAVVAKKNPFVAGGK